jgi:hypothetical protein
MDHILERSCGLISDGRRDLGWIEVGKVVHFSHQLRIYCGYDWQSIELEQVFGWSIVVGLVFGPGQLYRKSGHSTFRWLQSVLGMPYRSNEQLKSRESWKRPLRHFIGPRLDRLSRTPETCFFPYSCHHPNSSSSFWFVNCHFQIAFIILHGIVTSHHADISKRNLSASS